MDVLNLNLVIPIIYTTKIPTKNESDILIKNGLSTCSYYV